jgi:hypothetical protein
LESECLSTGLTKFLLVLRRLVNLQVRDEGKFGGLSSLKLTLAKGVWNRVRKDSFPRPLKALTDKRVFKTDSQLTKFSIFSREIVNPV